MVFEGLHAHERAMENLETTLLALQVLWLLPEGSFDFRLKIHVLYPLP